jgi:uncharacterized protein (TIGR03382 family)
MSTRLIGLATAAALTLIAPSASADFTGFDVDNKSQEYNSYASGLIVLELYALFDNPNDTLVNVWNVEMFASSDFYHSDESSLPSKKAFYDENGPFDSFVTIGFSYGGTSGNPDGPDPGATGDNNATVLDPSFFEESFLFGSSIDDPDGIPGKGAGWFNGSPIANNIQGKAGTYADNKVMLGRFAFDLTEGCVFLAGAMSLTYKPNNVGWAQIFDHKFVYQVPLSECVPSPGAAAAMLLAGLAGGRRRRP